LKPLLNNIQQKFKWLISVLYSKLGDGIARIYGLEKAASTRGLRASARARRALPGNAAACETVQAQPQDAALRVRRISISTAIFCFSYGASVTQQR
jgi:hypothetical protein